MDMEKRGPTRTDTTQSDDGLTLFAAEWGSGNEGGPPVVCLPGLSRNHRDFKKLAEFLSNPDGARRRVLALDYRGRGGSDRDPEWQNYSLAREQMDILTMLAHAGVTRADFIGTSRGGLHILFLAVSQPKLLGKVVLNDIGPVIETKGLRHLTTTIGKEQPQVDWAAASAALRAQKAALYPDLGDADWLEFAHQLYREKDGRIVIDYDPKLANTLKAIDFSKPQTPLWDVFKALRAVPVLAVRGALSDLLSIQTLHAMQARHPNLATLTVPDQGHAPLLWDRRSLQRIEAFLAR